MESLFPQLFVYRSQRQELLCLFGHPAVSLHIVSAWQTSNEGRVILFNEIGMLWKQKDLDSNMNPANILPVAALWNYRILIDFNSLIYNLCVVHSKHGWEDQLWPHGSVYSCLVLSGLSLNFPFENESKKIKLEAILSWIYHIWL